MADIPGDLTTGTTIEVGDKILHGIEASGDRDWFRIELTQGQQIVIVLIGIGLDDPLLRIRDSSGNILFENDDISAGVLDNSRILFTAPEDGLFFIDAGSGLAVDTGTYELIVEAWNPPPVATIDEMAEWMTSGFWGGTEHRFNVSEGDTITVNLTALSATAQDLARDALDLWTDVTGVIFVEVTSGGQIEFNDNQPGAFGHAFISGGYSIGGIVNISEDFLAEHGDTTRSFGFQTFIHEIGHVLGIGHSGDYDGGDADFDTDVLFANDGWSYSLMSYFDQSQVYLWNEGFSLNFALTPMLADIVAMTNLYGMSTTTRVGDTTYGFNSNADRSVFDATQNGAGSDPFAYTIIDSAGVDTLDYSGYAANQLINLAQEAFSNIGGDFGNVAIARGTVIENAIGGSGNDQLLGNDANNLLNGGGGNDQLSGGNGLDVLIGGAGADMLSGGAESDAFTGTAAGLSGDTISDFAAGDRILITDANMASFTFSLSGSTLTYSGGTMTLTGVSGTLTASAAAEGGVQLVVNNSPPPPPPPPSVTRARLILTESGQDYTIGGDIQVIGTAAAGEVIEILHGDVRLDASFNAGGDTVVLPGDADSYTVSLSGSFVTIAGGGVTVAIPVGSAGLNVQFADSTRVLRIDTGAGQVLLGTQQVTTAEQDVASAGPPLSNPPETGPDSFGRLLLTEAGQDIDIGGQVVVVGTTAGGEVVTVLHGDVRLDASFNTGGDTVVLAGDASDYSASLSGSFVTITDGDTSVAVPVGIAGLTVAFDDGDRELRIDPGSGTVMLGDQTVTSGDVPLSSASLAMTDLGAGQWAASPAPIDEPQLDPHRVMLIDNFVMG